jgi:hypothetical protein
MRIRPGAAVVVGAAVGLVSAGLVWTANADQSAGTTPTSAVSKPAVTTTVRAAAPEQHCGTGADLEHGVCVLTVHRTVAPPVAEPTADRPVSAADTVQRSSAGSSQAQAPRTVRRADSRPGDDSGEHADEPGDDSGEHADEPGDDSGEHADEPGDDSGEHSGDQPGDD